MTKEELDELTGELPYTLTNDYMFKAFLQKNEKVLRGLLCACLDLKAGDIKSVEILNPIKEGTAIDDKMVILDLKIMLNSNEIINLEMQVDNYGNWVERSLTYLCRMFDHLKAGEDYKNAKRTIHIGILDFTPATFPEDLYMDYFMYNKKHDHYYSSKFGLYMLQLNQVENESYEETMPDLYHWARLFKATTWEEVKMLAGKNETIGEGIVTLKELTQDERTRMACEQREKVRRDWQNSQRVAREEGQKLGEMTMCFKLVNDGTITPAQAAEKLGMTEVEFDKERASANKQ